ncbi:MAG: hypothetical protein CMF70_06875 [Magnetovibrio sp.]|nr:hypothetical protein [Magnetovibrio sp.]|tara:strand:- start:2295 stop:2477 length:183 start_codon:yes stop_codon:yes gene_type:complete
MNTVSFENAAEYFVKKTLTAEYNGNSDIVIPITVALAIAQHIVDDCFTDQTPLIAELGDD